MTSTAVLADNTSDRIANNPLIARVASILGISETELVGAFTTAIAEMKTEKLEEKLAENIANGSITEEEAQSKRERFDQKLDRKGDKLGLEHFKSRHHVHNFKSFTIPGKPRLMTPEELESKIHNIKILDPACGTGEFLIRAIAVSYTHLTLPTICSV